MRCISTYYKHMPSAEELYAQNLALKAELASLEAEVAWYRRQMFGAKSEKLPVEAANQIKLGLPETPKAVVSHANPRERA